MNSVVRLQPHVGSQAKGTGSGIYISTNYILTAAHVMYDYARDGKQATEIDLYKNGSLTTDAEWNKNNAG